jgi:hypothetical protein
MRSLCAPMYCSCPGKGVCRQVGCVGCGMGRDEMKGQAGRQASKIGCVKAKVKAHVRQIAGGSGAIRRYGRRAVNGKQPGSEGVERERM